MVVIAVVVNAHRLLSDTYEAAGAAAIVIHCKTALRASSSGHVPRNRQHPVTAAPGINQASAHIQIALFVSKY
jgi:hypothetical protein